MAMRAPASTTRIERELRTLARDARSRVDAGKASLADRRTLATLTLLETAWSRKKLALAFSMVYQRRDVNLASATWRDVARALESAPAFAFDLSKSIRDEKIGPTVQAWCRKLDQRNTNDMALLHQQAFVRQTMKGEPPATVRAAEQDVARIARASAKAASRRWHASQRKKTSTGTVKKKVDLGVRAALLATREKLSALRRGPLDY